MLIGSLNPSYKFTYLPLTMAILTLLTACGSGGFNNPNLIVDGHSQVAPVIPTTQTPPTTPPPTNPSDPLTKAVQGSFMPIPKRNQVYDANAGVFVEEHTPLDPQHLGEMGADSLADLKAQLSKTYQGKPLYQSDDQYEFVKAGWLFAGIFPDETVSQTKDGKAARYVKGDGFLYYYGDTPTTGLLKGKATYTGHWDFVSDVKRKRSQSSSGQWLGGGHSFGMDDRFGDKIGATSFSEQMIGQTTPRQGNHKAVFEADFDQKTLTGTLSTKKKATVTTPETYLDRYGIRATITGNRFVGSAVAKNTDPNFNLFSQHATNRLEGGFFGDNGQELAGKFLSDDNSLFGVFAGKQDGTPAVLDKKYDGLLVEVTQDKDINPKQIAQILPLANFANVNQLVVNGKVIDLLPETANKVGSQNIELSSGQKAVITSFGTADGVLRLGSIQKTAPANNSNTPTPEQIAKAKTKLQNQKEAQADKVDELVLQYIDAIDENKTRQIARLKENIITQALAGYSDGDGKTNAKAQLEHYLNTLKDDSENEEVPEQITQLVKQGDKYDVNVQTNWQAFLPTKPPKTTPVTANESLQSLYLLGERTNLDKMPKQGEVNYTGTWHAKIGDHYQSEAGYGKYDGKSSFVVDFGKKRLSGELIEKSGLTPAFLINANIHGNGFTGTATSRADGINLDKGQQQNVQILPQTVSTNLTGGFYGDDAKHLGGAFSFENTLQGTDKKVVGGAVFYGTKEGDK
ncbi:transferrin-binding protein-like solute binding protein [Moraxella oblonga]|uniref:transferrin-binding protein-like solute binding protein n=1 Tax=Moraxella oblonga TaxID=200413 RepID=UPI00082DE339|nr:transferrin-binding protein-like solute binding protein [Moraxella oblonga]